MPSTNAQNNNGVFCFFLKKTQTNKQKTTKKPPKTPNKVRSKGVRAMQQKSVEPPHPCCACCMLERAWEIGEKQNEDEEKKQLACQWCN